MSEIKTGGPAFPSGESYRNGAGNLCGKSALNQGMNIRDYFAAKAMQGLIEKEDKALPYGSRNTGDFDSRVAYAAYRYADAMLTERERGE